MKATKFIGIVLILFILGLSHLATGSLFLFIDIKSLIIVFGLLLGGIMFSSGVILPLSAIRCALVGNSAISPGESQQYSAFFTAASRLSIGAGVVGFFLGIICMLAVINDPDMIGPNLAVALLSAFYGALLSEFVIQPMKHAVIRITLENAG